MTQAEQENRGATTLITTGATLDAATIGVIAETLTSELVRVAEEVRNIEALMGDIGTRISEWRACLPPDVGNMADEFAVTPDVNSSIVGTPESLAHHQAMARVHQGIMDRLSGNDAGMKAYGSLRRAITDMAFAVCEHRRLLERLGIVTAELESMAV